jgi:hypothetical protein
VKSDSSPHKRVGKEHDAWRITANAPRGPVTNTTTSSASSTTPSKARRHVRPLRHDAEAAGDERLAGFFQETQSIQTQVAERAKEMLSIVASAPEFNVGSGSGSGTTRTETVEGTETGEHSGRGVPPTADAPRTTPPGEEEVRGRGVPPMPPKSNAPPREERLD